MKPPRPPVLVRLTRVDGSWMQTAQVTFPETRSLVSATFPWKIFSGPVHAPPSHHSPSHVLSVHPPTSAPRDTMKFYYFEFSAHGLERTYLSFWIDWTSDSYRWLFSTTRESHQCAGRWYALLSLRQSVEAYWVCVMHQVRVLGVK